MVGKGKGKGKGKDSKAPAAGVDPRQHRISLYMDGQQKAGTLVGSPCFAFNGVKGCASSNCRFKHICCVVPCGKPHSIWGASATDCPEGAKLQLTA